MTVGVIWSRCYLGVDCRCYICRCYLTVGVVSVDLMSVSVVYLHQNMTTCINIIVFLQWYSKVFCVLNIIDCSETKKIL